jgi:hypothetical protein
MRSVIASLVSSGTTRGEPALLGSASIASEFAEVTQLAAWLEIAWTSQRTVRGRYDIPDLTTGKEYLKTAQTLLRAAQTTDR